MSVINLKISIITSTEKIEFETKGYYQKDQEILIYKEKDNTTVKYDYKENILIRENSSISLKYKFNKEKLTKGKVFIKDLKNELEIVIKTKEIIINKQNIDITYMIDQESFNYKVEVN